MAEASAGARAANGQSDIQILQGIQRNIHAADESANKACEQLDQQTEQIRSIDKDVDHISSTMDQAAEIIKGMNPLGLLRQAIVGQKGGQSGRAECKWMWRETKVPSLFGGELAKRDPIRWSHYKGLEDTIHDIGAYKEERSILCKVRVPGSEKYEIDYENPADAVEKLRGILVLQQQAALAAVESPAAGPGSRSSSAAAPYTPPQAARPAARKVPLPGQEAEDLLADIGATLDGMHEKTQQMNRTLDVQNQMLPAVAEKMDRERQRAEEQTKKLQKMQGR